MGTYRQTESESAWEGEDIVEEKILEKEGNEGYSVLYKMQSSSRAVMPMSKSKLKSSCIGCFGRHHTSMPKIMKQQ